MTPSFVRTRFTVTDASNVSPTLSSPLSDAFSNDGCTIPQEASRMPAISPQLTRMPAISPQLMMSSLFRMHCKRRMHNTTGKCLKAQRASQSIMPRTRDAVRPSRSSALDNYTPRLRILLCARSRTRSPGRSPSHIAGGKLEKAPCKRLQAVARSRPETCAHSSRSTVPRRASCETLSALPRRRSMPSAPCSKTPLYTQS